MKISHSTYAALIGIEGSFSTARELAENIGISQGSLSDRILLMSAMLHYTNGDIRCQCGCDCPATDYVGMDFDHINNDGNIKRNDIGKIRDEFRASLATNGTYPSGIQVLCAFCNQRKQRGDKVCRGFTGNRIRLPK